MPIDNGGVGEGVAMWIGRYCGVTDSKGGDRGVGEANLDAIGSCGNNVEIRMDRSRTDCNMLIEEGMGVRGGSATMKGVGRGRPKTLALKIS